MVPIHPIDAGSTILGRPIRPHPWISEDPELFVIFLSAKSTLSELRKWLFGRRNIPFIWLQPGAESQELEEVLSDLGINYSVGKCWVTTVVDENLNCDKPLPLQPWCLQTTSVDGSNCSVWRHFPPGSDHVRDTPLEWTGDLIDLQYSNELIPQYVRSLVNDGETLEEASIRLS